MREFFKRHKSIVYAILVLFFVSFPQWLSAVWALFFSEPFFQWIQSKGLKIPSFSLLWITWPIGLVLLSIIAWNTIKQKREIQQKAAISESTPISKLVGPLPEEIKSEPTIRPDKKIIVDVTPAYLLDFYRNHLSVQADQLAKVYLGKWMKITGQFDDVSKCNDSYFKVSLGRPFTLIGGQPVHAFFKKEWADSLSVLPRGKNITLLGKIRKVEPLGVCLDDCELIDS